ncbi:hypothetical protein PISMIDRAFT_194944 [Pisolithus microcarpus 441]|uniref:Uncharacterized protein n=1 Tax=Pisolithus microcarpus 441 TaxID=765257 RepID=A0A0C9Y0E7_9AGAM|nr:hypothetical protein PISMIDRAFT_194944 [Pisolithus microcarpus 441]
MLAIWSVYTAITSIGVTVWGGRKIDSKRHCEARIPRLPLGFVCSSHSDREPVQVQTGLVLGIIVGRYYVVDSRFNTKPRGVRSTSISVSGRRNQSHRKGVKE